MPWARIDDGFHSHPKVRATSLAGRGLFVTLISYSANYLTDGIVGEEIVRDHARGHGGKRALAELLQHGLLDRADGGYAIHDYLDFNLSRDEVEGERRKNRERQDRHRNRGRQTQIAWDGKGETPRNAVTNAAHTSPSHTKPEEHPPTPSRGSAENFWQRIRDALRGEVTEVTFHIWLEPLELAAWDGSTLTVRAPEHTSTWVDERFKPMLARVATRIAGGDVTVAMAETDEQRETRERQERRDARSTRRTARTA